MNNNTALFKFNIKIAGRIRDDGTKKFKIRVSLKHLSNSQRTLENPLINCEINLILTWPNTFFIIDLFWHFISIVMS